MTSYLAKIDSLDLVLVSKSGACGYTSVAVIRSLKMPVLLDRLKTTLRSQTFTSLNVVTFEGTERARAIADNVYLANGSMWTARFQGWFDDVAAMAVAFAFECEVWFIEASALAMKANSAPAMVMK